MHHFEIDRQVEDRVSRFQREAEQARQAQMVEQHHARAEKIKPAAIRRRLGILLMRWGTQLAGYEG